MLGPGGMKASGPGRRAAGAGRDGMSGGRLRRSSGRSPPNARMAALSWASSGSSRLEQAESTSDVLGFRDGFAAVGRAGGFFWVSFSKTGFLSSVLVSHKALALSSKRDALASRSS